jgi:putative oxidoreductase
MFLISGVGKVGSYAATVEYMSAAGVPGALLPLVIAIEVLGAIAIIVGWKTRITAFLPAALAPAYLARRPQCEIVRQGICPRRAASR